jgi:hypothetical protein
MKKKLLEVKKTFGINPSNHSLSDEDLRFITGGQAAAVAGAGTSSTSGTCCCDGTCVCKKDLPTKPSSAERVF